MKEQMTPFSGEQEDILSQDVLNLIGASDAASGDGEIDLKELDALLGEHDTPRVVPGSVSHPAKKPVKKTFSKEKSPLKFPRITLPMGKKSGIIAIAAAVLLLLLTVGGILISAALDPFDSRMLDNTTIGGISVGGMTRWEAYQAVKAGAGFSQQTMEVTLPDGSILLAPDQTKAKIKIWPAVNEAYRLGRKGSDEEIIAAVDAASGTGTNIDLRPYLKLDQEYIRSQLEGYAAQYNLSYTELSYQLTGTQPDLGENTFDPNAPGQTLELTLGTPQAELDVDATLAQILEVYGRNEFQLTIDTIPPTMVPSAPDLQAINSEFMVAPVNTSVDLENCTIVPGSYGYEIDLDAAEQLLAQAGHGQTVSIPMKVTEPEIFGEGVYFRDELGYCETPHTNNENRNTNLRLGCAAIDGLILQPGEEFSFNGVVGERTSAKGYMPAPAYSGLATVNSTGGGVCQISSTLYNAALQADMEIVFRINHGYRSSYIGIGLDATVNWGGPDFQFRNNSHFPVMIKAEVSDGYVKVKLLGTDEKDYYIVMTSGYSEGDDYFTSWSYKNKYDKETGELISKEREAFSRYMK